jgi:hypothetical protein
MPVTIQKVERRCGSCHFWERSGDEGPECRRHSPTVFMVPLLNANGSPRGETVPIAYWPRTQYDDWCGEFMIKDVSASETVR